MRIFGDSVLINAQKTVFQNKATNILVTNVNPINKICGCSLFGYATCKSILLGSINGMPLFLKLCVIIIGRGIVYRLVTFLTTIAIPM